MSTSNARAAVVQGVSDYDVMETMLQYGGSFVIALGRAAQRADSENLARLKAAFPEVWHQYAEMAVARHRARNGSGGHKA